MATWKRKRSGGQTLVETREAPLQAAGPEMSGWRCDVPLLFLKVVLPARCALIMLSQYFGLHLGRVRCFYRLYYMVIYNKYKDVCSIG